MCGWSKEDVVKDKPSPSAPYAAQDIYRPHPGGGCRGVNAPKWRPMILIHLNKLRGIVADVLGAATVDDPGVADWECLRGHHREGRAECSAIVFEGPSECHVNI